MPRCLLVLSSVLMLSCSGPSAKESPTRASDDPLFVWDRPVLIPTNLPITKSATCRFKAGLAVSYEKKITNQELSPPGRVYYSESNEDEANTVSFVDLDTRSPKVQSNGGQGNLEVVNDSGEIVTVLNHPPGADGAELYTIFRKTGIVIYSQQKDSLPIGPFGVIAMGYCN